MMCLYSDVEWHCYKRSSDLERDTVAYLETKSQFWTGKNEMNQKILCSISVKMTLIQDSTSAPNGTGSQFSALLHDVAPWVQEIHVLCYKITYRKTHFITL
jgi:hypothetical protein